MSSDKLRRLFVFELAGESFALGLEAISEVLPVPLLARPPGTPSILQGFLNLGGLAIPVLNLKRLFLLPDASLDAYSHVIILRRTNAPLAVLVDRAVGTAEAARADLMPVAADHSFNDCAECAVRIGPQTAHVLSVERLLLKEERTRIAQLHAMEQERILRLEQASK